MKIVRGKMFIEAKISFRTELNDSPLPTCLQLAGKVGEGFGNRIEFEFPEEKMIVTEN